MATVGFGIIGCGVISGSHLKLAAASSVANVVAVADVVEDRAKARAEEFGVPAWYTTAEDLLQDERVDAVVLAMPTGVRTPVALKALEHGKHVLIEKPIALNAAEVERIMAARGDRVAACCSSRMTFTDHAETARACVAAGTLGDIRVVRVRAIQGAPAEPRNPPPPWRESMAQNGGGILVNWSCYDLDYLMYVTGWQLQPQSVMAAWWTPARPMSAYVAPGSDADAHYTAMIRCKNNIVLSMERAEFAGARTDQAWEIIGSHASLRLNMQAKEGQPDAVQLDTFVPGKGIESQALDPVETPADRRNVVDDFARAVLGESEAPRTTLERALLMQKLTDAIYASAESGASVSVS
ncbi:MAG: Gfo/Idh/MocA family oxidoreductase [Kiritimatiellae bacterium]|nr:Gfo/Idh/MocA family oxidoreductase [Kiritimatiellia bacterium]